MRNDGSPSLTYDVCLYGSQLLLKIIGVGWAEGGSTIMNDVDLWQIAFSRRMFTRQEVKALQSLDSTDKRGDKSIEKLADDDTFRRDFSSVLYHFMAKVLMVTIIINPMDDLTMIGSLLPLPLSHAGHG